MTAVNHSNCFLQPGIDLIYATKNAVEWASESVYQSVRQVEGYWDARNAEVKNWTDRVLPKPLAKIVQAFTYALPATLLLLSAPPIVLYPVLGIYSIFKIVQMIRKDTTIAETRKMISHGYGFTNALQGTYMLGLGIIMQNPLAVINGSIKCMFALITFGTTGLACDIVR